MKLPFCECGCGERVRLRRGKPNRYLKGHTQRGKKHTPEARRRMSEAAKHRSGGQSGMSGKNHSVETRGKISEALKGKTLSKETKRKMSEAHKGKTRSAEYRFNLSEAGKGHTVSSETKCKLSSILKGKYVGANASNWQGGISFDPYPPQFNGAFKQVIRERDGFMCKVCGLPENRGSHDCHHIDYQKTNNCPVNLILLCRKCHSKTNSNRAFWTHLLRAQRELGFNLDGDSAIAYSPEANYDATIFKKL